MTYNFSFFYSCAALKLSLKDIFNKVYFLYCK